MSLCPDGAATDYIKQILVGRFDMPRTALIVAALLTLLASSAGAASGTWNAPLLRKCA